MDIQETKQAPSEVSEKVLIKDKVYLTLNEARQYYNISINTLRKLTDNSNAVLWVSSRRLINRVQFEAELKELQNEKRKENNYGKGKQSKQRKQKKQS